MLLSEYEQIVGNRSSPTLVLSGPGSGKTYLLADRVKRLLAMGVPNTKITVLAFGVDAKDHMRDELTDRSGGFKLKRRELPRISTMHALALGIVGEAPRHVKLLKTGLGVLANEDAKRLLYRDASLILGHSEQDGEEARTCKARGDCKPDDGSTKCCVCAKYREIMSKCNYIDFDDQIIFACEILEAKPGVLRKYQDGAEHLLVDEYQDINAAQCRLIELLSRRNRDGLFVVGDDAQSIYRFRGCDPRFILNFAQHYPGSAVARLAHSRRCPEAIMRYAFKVLEGHYPGWTGETELEYHVEGDAEPEVWWVPSEKAEAGFVAALTRSYLPEKKVLILAPKASFFPLISKRLREAGVPHECPVGLVPERVGRVKLYMDWVADPDDNFTTRLVVEQLINTGIARVPGAKKLPTYRHETVERRIGAETEIGGLWENVNRQRSLFSVIMELSSTGGPLAQIRDALLSLRDSYANPTDHDPGEFAKRLAAVSGAWSDPTKLADDVEAIVRMMAPRPSTIGGSVELRTMRKAKGLEADIVMIVGLEDDIVPSPRGEVREQARLFYVAMTRAKERLFLFHSYRRPCNISFGAALLDKRRSSFLDTIGRQSTRKGFKPKH